jgi:hypothetical protein
LARDGVVFRGTAGLANLRGLETFLKSGTAGAYLKLISFE